jgi:hypothetical protein
MVGKVSDDDVSRDDVSCDDVSRDDVSRDDVSRPMLATRRDSATPTRNPIEHRRENQRCREAPLVQWHGLA